MWYLKGIWLGEKSLLKRVGVTLRWSEKYTYLGLIRVSSVASTLEIYLKVTDWIVAMVFG